MRFFQVLAVVVGATAAPNLSARDGPLDDPTGNRLMTRQSSLPSSFSWDSSAALVGPKSDGRGIAGIKDPSVVYYDGLYHVFASTASSSGYNLVYFSFSDFSQANSATFYYLDQSSIGSGYRAAPQVFYFEPDGLWYLVFQNGNAAYSTNSDISNPYGWSSPTNFYSGVPNTVSQNIGSGYWVDMWVICDSSNCYLFSSDDNGHLYRSQTSVSSFPGGMSEPVIAMSDTPHALFEAANVYSIGGGQYLLLVEAIGSDGARYFRSWTSSSISGSWTSLADTESNPFARANNVNFPSGAWTQSISHGEIVRTSVDQTLTITPCDMRYLYQGLDPSASGDYNSLPWRLGLLTQTNWPCSGDSGSTGSTGSGDSGDTNSGCTVSQWGQCGGIGYTGCTTCASSTCTYINDWYSLCS